MATAAISSKPRGLVYISDWSRSMKLLIGIGDQMSVILLLQANTIFTLSPSLYKKSTVSSLRRTVQKYWHFI